MAIILNPVSKIKEKAVINFALFADENYNILDLHTKSIFNDLKNFTKSIDKRLKKKDFLIFNLNSNQLAILIKLKKNQSELENEKKGASFLIFLKRRKKLI